MIQIANNTSNKQQINNFQLFKIVGNPFYLQFYIVGIK